MSRHLGALLAIGLLPWLVVVYPGGTDFVFAWGLLDTRPLRFLTLYDYLFVHTLGPAALPGHLLAWPLSTLFYLVALANAALSAVDREDRRVTVGLLVLVLAMNLRLWWGLSRARGHALIVPVGAVLVLVFVWWVHAADLRRMASGNVG